MTAFGLLLLFGLGAAWIVGSRRGSPDLPERVARDYVAFRDRSRVIEMQTPDGDTLERFFEHRGVPFRTPVADLGAHGYRLVGGATRRLGGLPSSAVLYQGGGRTVVVRRLPGSLDTLPPGGRTPADADVRLFHRRGVTLVFRQEGAVLVVTASETSPTEALALAP